MTRLQSADVSQLAATLDNYDRELIARTGYSLSGIACRAAGIDEGRIKTVLPDLRVGVVPISSGQGIIGGFCDAVLSILAHMGANAFVTHTSDVSGINAAIEKKADVMMLADDERFVALHIQSRQIADNAFCTGQAYATGLNLMTGGLKGKAVLVIGCGPVGTSATESLIRLGANVVIYDTDIDSSNTLAVAIGQAFNSKVEIVKILDSALLHHKYILDASPAGNIIHAQHITPDTYVSAPGMPCGLDEKAKTAISHRMLHDPLQLGVATMLISTAKHHCVHRAEG